jgi:CheY-like chemotaxis protein
LAHYVHADRTRVKQVLVNLLSNAIKYNSEQGSVEVRCTKCNAERIRVSIKDTGAGLNPAEISQLFQPFNRLGQEVGLVEGTGIGLVVAKRLVELMGGSIGVDSSVGVGSVFWFELVAVAAPQLGKAADPAAVVRANLTGSQKLHSLLYVEDNPANLKLVEQIIARHPNIRLLTAVNANSGIRIAQESLPDVILMDINLPGLNGYEAMKLLRADPITAHIPVIALSANAMPLDIEWGLKAGFFRYMTKPINVTEFMSTLENALKFAALPVAPRK